MRPTWDLTWLDVARVVERRSRCSNRQVGAVIVDATQRPVSMGYNGPPAGLSVPDDLADRDCSQFCERARTRDLRPDHVNCPAIHAEANALLFADRRDYAGGTLYTTTSCCIECSKLIANSGLTRVVMLIDEDEDHLAPDVGRSLMLRSGLRVTIVRHLEAATQAYDDGFYAMTDFVEV